LVSARVDRESKPGDEDLFLFGSMDITIKRVQLETPLSMFRVAMMGAPTWKHSGDVLSGWKTQTQEIGHS
jgi:hypothetical protein